MSFVTVVPEHVGQAAGQLENIGSALHAANAAAAVPTTGVVAAAGDEVSAAVAALFSRHAQEFQALNARAAAFHTEFTHLLNAGAGSYLSTEITNAAATSGGGAQFLGGGILSLLTGASAQYIELPLDAAGAVIVTTGSLGQSGTAFVNALQAGNSVGANAALVNAIPIAGNALLYGQRTVSIPLPLSVAGLPSTALNIPFGGLLAPLQPVTASVMTTLIPPLSVPTGFEVGGLITNLQANGPEVALALLLLGLSFA
jgi:hypothetical protein